MRRAFVYRFAATMLLSGMIALPASAFEIFGFQVFGDDEDVERVDVIDPQPYTVQFQIDTDDDDLKDALRGASALNARKGDPASGAAGLLATARGDYRRLLAALYAEGYYAGTINIRLIGSEVANLPVTVALPETAEVTVLVDPGPSFTFGQTQVVNPPPPPRDERDVIDTTARDAFRTGQPALAELIDDAGDEYVSAWREAGHATARLGDRQIVADHLTNQLDVQLIMQPGRAARFGDVAVTGAERVDVDFIRYMAELEEGASFDPDRIERAETRLSRLGVFSSFRLREAEDLNPDGTLPITIEVTERKRRRYGIGATISSIDGAGIEAYWLHRNLLGEAERLRFDASIDGIGDEGDASDYDYLLGVSFLKPGFLTQDANLRTAASLQQNVFDTYKERSVNVSIGFDRIVNEYLTFGLDLAFRASDVEDAAGDQKFKTIALIGDAEYDRRNDQTDPTNGYYLSAEVRPFYEMEFGNIGFRTTAEGRYYQPLDRDERYVLAGRLRIGSVIGDPREEMPTDLLFFSGGGGSVRGYPFRSNGVEIGGDVFGGRGLIEVSGEFRTKVTDNFGLVGFIDAGKVSEGSIPGSDGDTLVGIGAGIRYQTGVGPIRFDIARPLDPRPGDPSLAYFIGIGQAF